jgi:nucleoid DNA-binding protein
MTKNDLADRVAERTGLSGSQARQAVEAAIGVVRDRRRWGGRRRRLRQFSVSQRAPGP